MQIVASPSDPAYSSLLFASVEGVLSMWWDAGEEVVKFNGDVKRPTAGAGFFSSKDFNCVHAHDLPVTGLCAARGVEVDAVSVSADNKIVR